MNKSRKVTKDNSFLKSVLFGTIVGVILLMVLLFILAAILLSGKVSHGMEEILAIVCLVVSGIISGICGAKKRGRGVITTGACSGIGMLIVIIIVRLLTKGSASESINLSKIIIALVAGSAFGGVVSTKQFRKNSQLRKR